MYSLFWSSLPEPTVAVPPLGTSCRLFFLTMSPPSRSKVKKLLASEKPPKMSRASCSRISSKMLVTCDSITIINNLRAFQLIGLARYLLGVPKPWSCEPTAVAA